MQATIKDRVLSKIAAEPMSGCWIWMGAVDDKGYGRINVANANRYAHRVAYEALAERIRPGMTIDHICRVRCCVNPAHLRQMTLADNIRAAPSFSKGWKRSITHCPKGHEYTTDNIYIHRVTRSGRPYVGRVCKACHTARKKGGAS